MENGLPKEPEPETPPKQQPEPVPAQAFASVPAQFPNLRVKETVFRFVQVIEAAGEKGSDAVPQFRNGVSYSPNAVHIQATEKDCLLEESYVRDVCVGMKIRTLRYPQIPFNQLTMPFYRGVIRLELSTPVSPVWVFEFMTFLPVLKFLRFGSAFFNVCEERKMTKIEISPSVEQLQIFFDKKALDIFEKNEQPSIRNKLDNVLDLCSVNLTGLNHVDLTLPLGRYLNWFLDRLPHIKKNGEMTVSYAYGTVGFRTVKNDAACSTTKADSSSQKRQATSKPDNEVLPKTSKMNPTIEVEKTADKEQVDNVRNSNGVESVSNSNEVEKVPKLPGVETLSKPSEVVNVPKPAEVVEAPNPKQIEEMPKPAEVQKVPKPLDVKNGPLKKEVKEEPNVKQTKNVPRTGQGQGPYEIIDISDDEVQENPTPRHPRFGVGNYYDKYSRSKRSGRGSPSLLSPDEEEPKNF